MMKSLLSATTLLLAVTVFAFTFYACNASEAKKSEVEKPDLKTEKQWVERGEYLVNTVGGCGDCHSPKIMGPHGPEFDMKRHMSGHPANDPLPPLKGADPFTPGNWIIMGPDLTSFVGPWGLSFTANLTPHPSAGIGSWKVENFIAALRTGKHMGVAEGRPIMPPMPWQTIGKMTDDDLKAIFTYLKTLPPIDNLVPAPLPPDEARKILK